MKRIINGTTYDTRTSQLVAEGSYSFSKRHMVTGEALEWTSYCAIYRTRTGAFFDYTKEFRSDIPECDLRRDLDLFEHIVPITYDEAHRLVKVSELAVLADGIFPRVSQPGTCPRLA